MHAVCEHSITASWLTYGQEKHLWNSNINQTNSAIFDSMGCVLKFLLGCSFVTATRQRSHYAGEILNQFIYFLRLPAYCPHYNPSRKGSFSKTLLRPKEFENTAAFSLSCGRKTFRKRSLSKMKAWGTRWFPWSSVPQIQIQTNRWFLRLKIPSDWQCELVEISSMSCTHTVCCFIA